MPDDPLDFSKSRVNRSGDLLRRARMGGTGSGAPGQGDPNEIDQAFQLLDAFRAAHQYPLSKVTMGLKSFVRTAAGEPVVVVQRLKRAPQIVSTLVRFPTMNLARMEDVGGCRAVLANSGQVNAVRERIEARWDVKRLHDYVAAPQTEGYRGVHLVVLRDARRIEIQLRTRGQQEWSVALESFAGSWGSRSRTVTGRQRFSGSSLWLPRGFIGPRRASQPTTSSIGSS